MYHFEVSIIMSSCSLKFSSKMSNLLLILASVICILFIVVFISISLVCVFFTSHMGLNTWNTVIIVGLTSLAANYNICVSSGSILVVLLFSSSWTIFCMPGNLCLHTDIVNFTLLGATYFDISVSSELRGGTWK